MFAGAQSVLKRRSIILGYTRIDSAIEFRLHEDWSLATPDEEHDFLDRRQDHFTIYMGGASNRHQNNQDHNSMPSSINPAAACRRDLT